MTSLEKVTLRQGAERANQLAEAYSKERIRLEESFTKLLLPATISIAALLTKDIFVGQYFYYALFLTAFFAAYTALIGYDLYASERLLDRARRAQDSIYLHSDIDNSTSLEKALSADECLNYSKMEAGVGRQHYFMPTGKLLTSVLVAIIVSLIMWITH